MKKSFRAASIVCALTLLASLATACGNGGGSTTSNGSSTAPDSSTAPSSSEPAVTLENAPTVEWYTVGGGEVPSDLWAQVTEQIDPITVEKAGCKVHINCIDWGNWDTKRNNMLNTNEPFDIMFTNNTTFTKDVNENHFADISEILKNDAKELYEFTPDLLWSAVTVGGKIYGVPTYKDSAMSQQWCYDKALVDELNIDYENINTLEELEPALKAIKESGKLGEGDYVLPLTNGGISAITATKYDGLTVGCNAVGLKLGSTKDNAKVVNVFEQDDVKKDLGLLHKFMQDGYINPDAAQISEAHSKYSPVMTAQGFEGAQYIWAGQMGIDACVIHTYCEPFYTSDTVMGSINCIGSNSKLQKEAVKLLQVVNTDTTVRNLLAYGPMDPEGTKVEDIINWQYTDEDKDCITRKPQGPWPLAAYTQGTFFIMLPEVNKETKDAVAAVGGNAGEQYSVGLKTEMEKAKAEIGLGFVFDPTNVADQIANCNAVIDQYKAELLTGSSDPDEKLPEMNQKLKDNGLDDIIAEAQKQLDEFLKNK